MFVQIIQGHVSDAGRVRAQLDKWVTDVSDGAIGWLGSTSGVTEDGQVVALVRFESAEAAEQNSSRPEQTAWWEEMSALFTDEPVVPQAGHVAVVAEEFDATFAALTDAGFAPEEHPRPWGAARAFTRTPGGHLVEFMAQPPVR